MNENYLDEFGNIQKDILANILSYCSFKECITLTQICKNWRAVLDELFFKRNFYDNQFGGPIPNHLDVFAGAQVSQSVNTKGVRKEATINGWKKYIWSLLQLENTSNVLALKWAMKEGHHIKALNILKFKPMTHNDIFSKYEYKSANQTLSLACKHMSDPRIVELILKKSNDPPSKHVTLELILEAFANRRYDVCKYLLMVADTVTVGSIDSLIRDKFIHILRDTEEIDTYKELVNTVENIRDIRKGLNALLTQNEIDVSILKPFHNAFNSHVINNVVAVDRLQWLFFLTRNYPDMLPEVGEIMYKLVDKKNLEGLKFILEHYDMPSPPDFVNVHGCKHSLVHIAVARVNLDMLQFLLIHGASPMCVDGEGAFPLELATKSGHIPIIKTLLDCENIDKNTVSRNSQKRSPLSAALESCHFNVATLLVDDPRPLNFDLIDMNAVIKICERAKDYRVLKSLIKKDQVLENQKEALLNALSHETKKAV